MNWNDIKKNWKSYRSQIKSKWSKLTEADLDKIAGTRATLVKLLKDRHGLDEKAAEKQIDDFVKSAKKVAA